ncbi:MAG: hypothetical protein WCJ85_02695 [Chitinophagaceae bacterium]
MIHFRCLFFGVLLSYSVNAQNFGGNPPDIHWKQINTAKVRIIFPTGLDSQANRMANLLTVLHQQHFTQLGKLERKWNIVLQSQTTIPNAYVRMAPVVSELNMTPDQDNFSTGSIRWDDNLLTHEDRHIQQFSNFNSGVNKLFSFFLGQEGQLLGNAIFIPNYFFEGDAVWQETLVSHQGRGRMPSFYNGFKSLWMEQKNYPWIKIRSGSMKSFVPDHYPLGYMMVAYGYHQYGEDFWRKITNQALSLKGFNKGIRRSSGKSFSQYYNEVMQYFSASLQKDRLSETAFQFITDTKHNNVVDYQYPAYISDDSIVVTKKSYNSPAAFYLLTQGKEFKIKARNISIDDYFSYRNGKIVYSSFQSDPRWGNRDYSVLQLLDIYSGKQTQLSFKSKYFSPDINFSGTQIIAVSTDLQGKNELVILDAANGTVLKRLPNSANYFYTQTKFVNDYLAVAAVRNMEGKMALITIALPTGTTSTLTPFTYNVLGYPFVKEDTVYFSCMYGNSDKVFAVNMKDKKLSLLTNNVNGVYHPAVNSVNNLLVSAFTAEGYRLAEYKAGIKWDNINMEAFTQLPNLYLGETLQKNNLTTILQSVPENKNQITAYHNFKKLINFHSWRPVYNDPELGYTFFSNDVLSKFNTALTYNYNRTDKSHTIEYTGTYAGWYPLLSINASHSFNRSMDTAIGKSMQFNTAKLQAAISLPLSFVGGRFNQYLNMGLGYNIEPFIYKGIGKNVFNNKAIDYVNTYISFTNQGRQALQNIFPSFAQSIGISYRDAFTFRNSHKLTANASLYFPGLRKNHSLVINASFQKRDSLPDLFSKSFSYSRGYEALSTRQMYKWGVNYHLPLLYPDWGLANLLFFQRIRTNLFYDYTNARARVNGLLTDIKQRSAGTELYFDTKFWNALPISFGVRYSHLLDQDLFYPTLKNRWEFILPIGLIPE